MWTRLSLFYCDISDLSRMSIRGRFQRLCRLSTSVTSRCTKKTTPRSKADLGLDLLRRNIVSLNIAPYPPLNVRNTSFSRCISTVPILLNSDRTDDGNVVELQCPKCGHGLPNSFQVVSKLLELHPVVTWYRELFLVPRRHCTHTHIT